jgi:hypothetical protein
MTQQRGELPMYSKMEGTEIQSFVAFRALIPRFAKTGITPWQTAAKGTAVCHNRNNPLAIHSQI